MRPDRRPGNSRPGWHFEAVRVSRRVRRCEDCRGLIEVGERYRRLTLPPSSDFSNDRWWWGIFVHDVDCRDVPPVPVASSVAVVPQSEA